MEPTTALCGSYHCIALSFARAYSFYSSLVAYLNDGTPMSVVAAQSRDVVAIMQAAEESALANGKAVSPILLRA